LKTSNKIYFLSFFLLLSTGIFFSFINKKNTWSFIKSIQVPTAKKVSIDRYYNFYIADNNGNIFKYDSLGNEINRFSPQKKANVSLLEAWKTVNIFVFYRELQEYNLLDRFLTTSTSNFKINSDIQNEKTIGFARIATVAPDNNLWIFDDNDFSLKKYDTRLNKILFSTSLDLILDPQFYDLNYMREYQNLLFINDRNSGILVFDNLGNYKRTLPYKSVEYFNFLGNYLYFLNGSSLILLDIYSGVEKEVALPEDKKYNFLLISPGTVYFFLQNKVDIYKLDLPTGGKD
jgi:hypothetical protein